MAENIRQNSLLWFIYFYGICNTNFFETLAAVEYPWTYDNDLFGGFASL